MTWVKSFLYWFFVILAVMWGVSAIVGFFIAPLVAGCFGILYAACQSGNTMYLFLSMWGLPAIFAVPATFYAVKYNEMKKKLEELEDDDADR